MGWIKPHDDLTLLELPGTDVRTNSPSCRRQPFAAAVLFPGAPGLEAGHQGVGSLVGEVSITEAGASLPPVLLRDPFEKLASKLRNAPGDEDHRITDIQIADLTPLIEAPPVPGRSGKAHLAPLRNPNIPCCCHHLSIQGEIGDCLVSIGIFQIGM